MSPLGAGLLGALGALLHDVFELAEVVRARRGDVPEEWSSPPFLLATLLRIGAGAAVAVVVAILESVGPIACILLGVLGPLGLQRLAASSDTGKGRRS